MKPLWFISPLKGILCIWIVLFHYTTRYFQIMDIDNPLPFCFDKGAQVGVPIFFFISGFLTHYSTISKVKQISWSWVKSRLIRLYPMFAISAIIITIIVNVFPYTADVPSIKTLLYNLLLIPIVGYKYVDGAHWYIFALLKFYIIYYILSQKNISNNIVAFLLLATCLVSHFLGIKLLKMVTLNDGLLHLLAGCMLASSFKSRTITKGIFAVLYSIGGAICCSSYLYIIYLLLFFVFLFTQQNCNFLQKIINSRPLWLLSYIGEFSFIWYLIHQNIGYSLITFMHNGFGWHYEVCISTAILSTVLLSIILMPISSRVDAFLKK